jgi:hypothetical protein
LDAGTYSVVSRFGHFVCEFLVEFVSVDEAAVEHA